MRSFLLWYDSCETWAAPVAAMCLALASSVALAFPVVWMANAVDAGRVARVANLSAAASLVCPSLGGK